MNTKLGNITRRRGESKIDFMNRLTEEEMEAYSQAIHRNHEYRDQ